MRLTQAVRETVLAIAKREGWKHPSVRITPGRKVNKLTVRLSILTIPSQPPEQLLRAALDDLRKAQSVEVQRVWPEVEIKVHAIEIRDVRHESTTIVNSPMPKGTEAT